MNPLLKAFKDIEQLPNTKPMTTENKANLRNAIEDIIHANEHQIGHQLQPKEVEFLINVCLDFVYDNIRKFIAGGLEHQDDGGDFLTSVDHKKEIWNEILDLANYLKALNYKRK